MPVTVLAHLTVAEDQPVALAAYFKVTQPLLEAAGGRIIKRFRLTDPVVGQMPSQTVVIVEYPSRAAVAQVFDSPEYQAIIPIRDIAFPTYRISIVEE
ncbi:DUF1330 domain-containing protein [Stagnihabitans tardus]|uniref:DUF1330 domain-containing protein n=1 Tax=Stagnihabitans tardus TaxID=2699202 RepID=A0AAE5BS96_9RHOB|nr:DUF1330 domain-containing protein [Stagnihabitans tardus]NBZ87560.1 DUF1330 domain-containing protein [Stagnihabitans tardus]